MKVVPYASALRGLQYAQGCTRPDLAFVTGLLGRYQSNPGIEHWRMVKKVLRYLQCTKGLMLTYRRSDSLHIEGYSDSDFAGDDRKSTSGIYLLSQEQLCRGKAPSKPSLYRLRCMPSLYHVMRPQGR
jgi:hypothetical protein